MRCLDSTFLIDLLKGDSGAADKMGELDSRGEHLSIAAPCAAELLIGAHFKGGDLVRDTADLLSRLDILEIDGQVAAQAGRLGAELLRRGKPLPTTDLLIAAAAMQHQQVLVTRDEDFHGIPGLVVEGY